MTNTYPCRMKGCVGNGTFTMEPKEEAWHREKFGHLPTNCPACREWKKEQSDVRVTCEACDFSFTITAEQIIGWHIHEGIWEKPKLCNLCASDRNRELRARLRKSAHVMARSFYKINAIHPTRHLLQPIKNHWFVKNAERKIEGAREYVISWIREAAYRKAQRSIAAREQKLEISREQAGRLLVEAYKEAQDLSRTLGVTKVTVTIDPQDYMKARGKDQETLWEHLHRHFTNNKLIEKKGKDERANLYRIGVKDLPEVLPRLAELIAILNPDEIMEFRDANSDYLVKYHFETGSTIVIHDRPEVTETDEAGNPVKYEEPPPPPPYIRTYVPKGIFGVGIKIQKGEEGGWLPNEPT